MKKKSEIINDLAVQPTHGMSRKVNPPLGSGIGRMRCVVRLVLTLTALYHGSISAQEGWTAINDSLHWFGGISSPGQYKGAAWVDYDNDADLDLFAAPNFLLNNNGNGALFAVQQIIGADSQQDPGGSSWGDVDNDGDPDCALAHYPSGLWRHDVYNVFTPVSGQLDSLIELASWGCAMGNMDGDAFPEIIYVHAVGFHPPGAAQRPCRLYRNQGGFSPTLVRGYTFTESTASYTVPYWSDYDLDGDMDLFIASGPGGSPGFDHCYRNMRIELGVDTLYEMTSEAFAAAQQDGQCYNFIDADNDGDLDLCLTNYAGAPSRFYRNNGGTYVSETTPFTTGLPRLANCWGDYDNDGDLDVVITSDYASARYYSNDGTGEFTLRQGSISTAFGSSGAANGDMDNDGDLDLFIHGADNAVNLFRNDTVASGRNWYSIKLIGTASGSSALGALVRLKAMINGTPTWQLREVNAQNSFQGHNDLRVHFGLNDAIIVDSLEVRWPSGTTQVFVAQPTNTRLTLIEGASPATSIIDTHTSPGSPELFTVTIDRTNGSLLVQGLTSCRNGRWTLTGTNGQLLENGLLSDSFRIDLNNLSGRALLLSGECGSHRQTSRILWSR